MTQSIETIAARAAAAAVPFAAVPPRERARMLVAVADALEAASDELVALGVDETGLSAERLAGELKRTHVQLRLFADVVVDGGYLDVRIDEADPAFVLGVRPDLRRYLVPVGPVLNFAASNFPFAFSVAGGDSAAALASGSPLVVKVHPGHPRLSERTADVVAGALAAAGAPEGVFQIVEGQEEGVALLKHPSIKAASFTGSIGAGRFLADVAAARPEPIPFYGELGSVNPVIVTAEAIAERATEIATGFAGSVAGSAGQLCTKPGFLFVPAGGALDGAITDVVTGVPEHRLLYPKIAQGFGARRDAVLGTEGVRVLAPGSLRFDDDGNGWATPTIVSASVDTLLAERETLLDESFGPLSVLVEYAPDSDLAGAYRELFEGNLTATLHLGADEQSVELDELVRLLGERVGRVLFGGWPTGVAVTPAQQHGGPWPATTNDTSTSVGTAAIRRFLRPVAYQGAPDRFLPAPLRDSNPWGVPQARSVAGESMDWGSAAGRG